jgi:putative hemolysin
MESDSLWGELLPVGLAILLYGLFEAAEVALRSAQKSRLQQWKDEGKRGAAEAFLLHDTPEPYLMTVRMVMTFLAVFAAALAGAVAIYAIAPWLAMHWPFLGNSGWAPGVSLALTMVVLTYGLVLGGQLLPKAIAQQYPEHILCWLARYLITLTKICKRGRGVLTASLTVVLWLLGQRPPAESASISVITEEAITTMVREGAERGIFEELEHELIEGVFEFTDTAAREIMVPRVRIEALEVNTPPPEVLHRMSEIGRSRVPVYSGDLDHIIGVLYFKDLMRVIGEGHTWELRALLHPPLFVPETVQISLLLRTLQQRHLNMAIVVDEHGGVAGLVTIEDVLEQLVGDIRDEQEPEEDAGIVQLPDGALVIEGGVPLWELRERFALPVEESSEYQTLAGLLLARLGRIPKGGETIHEHGYTFTVVDVEGPRIARVKVEQREPPEARGALTVPPPADRAHQVQEQQGATEAGG